MNRELPSHSHLSSKTEANDQTSVSYPYTRYNTFSATKLTGLGSRIIKFQPIRSAELTKAFLESEDGSPVVIDARSKTDDKYKARKIIIDSTSDSSDDEANKNILNTTIIEDDEDKTIKKDALMPGVMWLAESPAKKPISQARDKAATPMSSIFNKMSLNDDRSEKKSCPSTAQSERRNQNVNSNVFKTPIVKSSRILSTHYNTASVSSKSSSASIESNMQTPAGQRIQYSVRNNSAIKDNAKPLSLLYNSQFAKKKQPDYITPRKDQNYFLLATKFETPRPNIQASIARNQYCTPRQTPPVLRAKQDTKTTQPKNSDVVLREKNLNVIPEHHVSHESDGEKQTYSQQRQQQNDSAKSENRGYVNDSYEKQKTDRENVHVNSENQRNVAGPASECEKQLGNERCVGGQCYSECNKQSSAKYPIPGATLPDSMFQSLCVRGKGYIVINKLGEGGSCQVYNCLEQDTLQARAIKVVNLAVDAVTCSGYINEVKLLRDLQGNDRVIKMFEYEHVKQTLFVVMERGDVDFSVFLRTITTESQVPTHIIICYWIEMLKCVKEIHKNGIIHSDLKPNNFLIVGGRLKLIDFGIASRLSSEMTSVIKDVRVGTFNYISPEAVLDSRDTNSPTDGKPRIRISYKSDVWSLGCILYQMIYRRTPFHNYGNMWAKITVIVDRNHCIEYPHIEGVPPKLIEIIKSCLIYEMKSRPTVEELLNMYTTNLYC